LIVSMIAAMSANRVIGVNNKLPWHLPADLKYFMQTTSGHHIIMGRKNFESLPRPLPRRTNIVITRQTKYQALGTVVVNSLEEALALARFNGEKEAFIIGGSEIYKLGFAYAHKLYLTYLDMEVEGDVYFPEYNEQEWKLESERFFSADKKNKYDHTYRVFNRAD